MRIVVIVEGKTERAFRPHVHRFLGERPELNNRMPQLVFVPCKGRLPKEQLLKRDVERHLNDRDRPADAVIALTDVYTGTQPPEFKSAADAKAMMKGWVGRNERFHPHAAQHDFEAWLVPYWQRIQQISGSNRAAPGNPEGINHREPPSKLLKDVFRTGTRGKLYDKELHGSAILKDQDLTIAARSCPELKAFLNTILQLSGGDPIA